MSSDEELIDLNVRVLSEEPALPEDITARQFLHMVMRGEIDPAPKQVNAAKVLIEYQEPKLSAVAVGHLDQSSFAAALDRAILRSQGSAPKALPPPEQHPASELTKPFVLRRRNFR
jgi:hypothetical protein